MSTLLPFGVSRIAGRARASYWNGTDYKSVLHEIPPGIHALYGPNIADLRGRPRLLMPWQYFSCVLSYQKTYLSYERNPQTGAYVIGKDGNYVRNLVKDAVFASQHYLYWSKERYTNSRVKLISGILPDVDLNSGACCFGDIPTELNKFSNSLESQCFAFFDGKSTGLHGGYRKPKKYATYKEWAEASLADPEEYLTWEEWQTGRDLSPDVDRYFFP